MNAPLPEPLRRALQTVSLDDKYALDTGRAFMSGIHALVRLPMLQRQRDALAGRNTAGFVSGYRGSPLGGYDQMLWRAQKYLKANHVVFQPGVNEELAATAVWGTQTLGYAPRAPQRYDGVFGIWYGKGPGVDRCSDVFKHANMAGTTPWGGVIAVAGDDHIAKSSTAAHQSDHIFKACGFPVFFPANVQEILDLGVHAFAMSRYAGVWAGMKTIQEIVESSAAVAVDASRVQIVLPQDFDMPPGGLHIRWPDTPLAQEERLFHYKWYAALAYIRANRLNHNVIEGPNDQYGIMASGKAYNDLRQALQDLGLDDAACRQLGIRIHKVGVVWPLEVQGTRAFARGLKEILVVEEKRQIIEYALKEELYNWRMDVRPNVVGKFDEGDGPADEHGYSGGEWSMPNPTANTLLRANADLSPALIARALVRRLKKTGVLAAAGADMQARIESQMALLEAKERSMQQLSLGGVAGAERTPWFCSGCPHNTSTVVSEGSRAFGGIGCHYMATWMDRSTIGFTQMGGEGVPWVGQQPFTDEKHVFTNLGDGTYFHSGSLAIRQSIAAGANITYKILYNDAVAMTGGQTVGERPEGHSVLQIAQSLVAEGVARLVIVTDEPAKYEGVAVAGSPAVYPREQLDRVQRELREVPGVTALIYDQTCATEKRRRRKRGKAADPAVRVLINEAVCEGCGDCGVQSNCISVEPLDTEFGRKRTINQSTCNKDLSCLRGFCPSFVTVEGGQLRKKAKGQAGSPADLGALPEPALPALSPAAQGGQPWGVVVAGVGGTGVITIGQLLGVAAHLEGKGIVTQDAAGLAQKGGATWSHVLIGATQDDILTTRVGTAAADLVLACDPMVAVHHDTLARMREGRTRVALNSHGSPTATFVRNADWHNPQNQCLAQIAKTVGSAALGQFDANATAVALLGDSIYVNPLMLGYAWQKGWIPLTHAALMRAIELNAVAVPANQAAFEWGRQAAERPEAVAERVRTVTDGGGSGAVGADAGALGGASGANAAHLAGAPGAAPAAPAAGAISGPAGDAARPLPPGVHPLHFQPRQSVEALVARRVEFLTRYQNAAYAQQYRSFVANVQKTEASHTPGQTALAEAVARYLFKLMAYKDEYEVARLHRDPAFLARIDALFEGDYKLHYHLAPPTLSARDEHGHGQKRRYGPMMGTVFALLARGKAIRNTWLDPFARNKERKAERALIRQYRATLEELLHSLSPDNHTLAVEIARLPESIRGYGHVKERHLQATRTRWDALLAQWRQRHGG